jgi:hypothetical protein
MKEGKESKRSMGSEPLVTRGWERTFVSYHNADTAPAFLKIKQKLGWQPNKNLSEPEPAAGTIGLGKS